VHNLYVISYQPLSIYGYKNESTCNYDYYYGVMYISVGVGVGPCKEFWTCFSKEVVNEAYNLFGYYLFTKCDNSQYT